MAGFSASICAATAIGTPLKIEAAATSGHDFVSTIKSVKQKKKNFLLVSDFHSSQCVVSR